MGAAEAVMVHCEMCGKTTAHFETGEGKLQCRRCVLETSVPPAMAIAAAAEVELENSKRSARLEREPNPIPKYVVGVVMAAVIAWLILRAITA
jgi:hypothetical protein